MKRDSIEDEGSAPGDAAAGRLPLVVLVLALAHLALFLFVVGGRVSYPYELEWMEGGMVDHVARVVGGDVWVYGPPNVESISFLYTPLYYHLAALVAQVMGVSHFTLRTSEIFP